MALSLAAAAAVAAVAAVAAAAVGNRPLQLFGHNGGALTYEHFLFAHSSVWCLPHNLIVSF